MEHIIKFRISAYYTATPEAKSLDQAKPEAEEAFSNADFGEAEDIDGNIVSITEEENGHIVLFKVNAYYTVAVDAKSTREARQKAEEEFSNTDFGEAEDVDGFISSIRDASGKDLI